MHVFVAGEANPQEKRVAIIPAAVAKLIKLAPRFRWNRAGPLNQLFGDDYVAAGATIMDRPKGLAAADMVLRLGKPIPDEVDRLKPGCIHISYLDPFNQPALLQKLAKAGTSAICMEMIPRSTICQKMDALSSQANLGGYESVVLAARYSTKIFPMMTTPAGRSCPPRSSSLASASPACRRSPPRNGSAQKSPPMTPGPSSRSR